MDSIEDKERKRDSPINNKMKSVKPAEKRRLEKAYRIIESSLIEPMIIELKDYGDATRVVVKKAIIIKIY